MAFDRVLIITYLFPPSGGVGVSRFVSYARYLPLHNCQPFILTARNPATPTFDYDLAKRFPRIPKSSARSIPAFSMARRTASGRGSWTVQPATRQRRATSHNRPWKALAKQ